MDAIFVFVRIRPHFYHRLLIVMEEKCRITVDISTLQSAI